MVDNLTRDHLQAIRELDNRIQAVQHENLSLQGKILAKDLEKYYQFIVSRS